MQPWVSPVHLDDSSDDGMSNLQRKPLIERSELNMRKLLGRRRLLSRIHAPSPDPHC